MLVFIWASVFLFNLNNVRKIGVIKIEYIKKYIIVGRGMFIHIRANIQPMWVIDEYAMIVRKWDWFIPINPPVIALRLAKTSINDGDNFVNRNDIMDSGASFCHVDRIKAGIHLMDVITEGYQKWHGAIPILISNENNKITAIFGIIWLYNHIDDLLRINRLDPRAWVNKYFTDASVSWKFVELLIIGINEIKLSSIASQIINQFVLVIAIIVLIISVVVDMIKNGEGFVIKMRLELNHQIWVRSSYFARHTS